MDTGAEAIKEKLLALEGVDEEVLDGCDVLQHLPSILGDGEMPEALLVTSGICLVATDRQLIVIEPVKFRMPPKVKFLPYEDIRVVKHTIFLGIEGIEVVMRDDPGTTLNIHKHADIDGFLGYLNTKCLVRRMPTEKERSKRKRERRRRAEQRQRKGPVKCRKCRSEQLSTQPKGFDWGKAIVGGVLTLPVLGVGALFGFWGYGKTIVTCVGCGHAWYAGQ